MSRYYRKKVSKWLANSKPRKTYAARKKKVRFMSIIVMVLLGTTTVGLLGVFGVIAFFSKDLPSPDRLTQRDIPQSTKIFSADGVLLYEIFGDERRTLVVLDDIPEALKQATLAVEDQDFYTHQGFDIPGMLRAAWVTLRGGGLQGGSTLTQQVVKNTLLTPERTITRKIKEFILSVQLERRYSKDQILQMYFNESPYGGQAWGVGAAAEMYYGKHVRDLTLAESTMIAGLPQSPTYYSPCGAFPENAKLRQDVVLSLMERNGYITTEQKEEVQNTELNTVCQGYGRDDIKAPHFVMYVKSLLTDMFGEKLVEQGGLRVTTTLDWTKQQIAQEEVEKQLESLAAQNANATNAGVVVVDPKTGFVTSMVGSVDYFDTETDGNVNVILAERQPGSSIKPITFLTAFTLGYSPATYVSDIRTCFPGGAGNPDYCPVNWDDAYWGPMSVRTALSNSRNIPAVKMLQVVGLQNMVDVAHDLGITTLNEPERYGLSLTLGGGEVRPIDMAQAYAAIANMGERNDLVAYTKVEDASGNVLHEHKPSPYEVINPEYTYLVNHVLSDSNARKTTFGGSLEIGRVLAAKTGTTNDNRDAWTIGYTPDLVSVVWVGNFNNEEMNGIQGSTGATPIMKGVMSRFLEGIESKAWERPAGVTDMDVDQLSGLIPQENGGFPVTKEVFVKGSEPSEVDDFHVTVTVCTDDREKLATEYHIDNELSEERTFTYLKELSSDWQPYTDEWMQEKREEGYGKAPEDKCNIKFGDEIITEPVIRQISPVDGAQVEDTKFLVDAKVYSNERILKVEFYWDGTLIETVTSSPYQYEIDLDALEADQVEPGNHTITLIAFDSSGEEMSSSTEITLIETSETDSEATPSPTPTSEESE